MGRALLFLPWEGSLLSKGLQKTVRAIRSRKPPQEAAIIAPNTLGQEDGYACQSHAPVYVGRAAL